jgi:hypothetical protein
MVSEFVVLMGEKERGSFDDEIERCGPLAARFNLRRGFRSSKLDLSRPNVADTFVKAVDVVERTKDCVDVDGFSFNECVPFCTWESCWCC